MAHGRDVVASGLCRIDLDFEILIWEFLRKGVGVGIVNKVEWRRLLERC